MRINKVRAKFENYKNYLSYIQDVTSLVINI